MEAVEEEYTERGFPVVSIPSVIVDAPMAFVDGLTSIYDTLLEKSRDQLSRGWHIISAIATLMMSISIGFLFRNSVIVSHQKDFENALCASLLARQVTWDILANGAAYNGNGPLLKAFPDGVLFEPDEGVLKIPLGNDQPPIEIPIGFDLSIKPSGKYGQDCASLTEKSREMYDCLERIHSSSSDYPEDSPMCPRSLAAMSTKIALKKYVPNSTFRMLMYQKAPKEMDEVLVSNAQIWSGVIAILCLAATVFAATVFSCAHAVSPLREDKKGYAIRRFSYVSTPALLLTFIQLLTGLCFTIDYLVLSLEPILSTVSFSNDVRSSFTYFLMGFSVFFFIWALIAFLYSIFGLPKKERGKKEKE